MLFGDASALTWSTRMADSQIARTGTTPAWNYETGFFVWSLFVLDGGVSGPTYRDYATAVISRLISSTGVITGYSISDYNIDQVMAGRNLLELQQRTGEVRYRTAAATLRSQLQTHPRTSEGGFWHKQVYPSQMWLDGIYMGEPFYCRYGLLYGEPAIYDDVATQFRLIDAHTCNATAQLWYHGWDESKTQVWANPVTGASGIFWGRAIGWYGMALVDTLDYLPASHPGRAELLNALQRYAAGIVRYQHPVTGVWYQVVDQTTSAGNYLEASCSSMFTYVLAKGINKGYLSAATYKSATIRAYTGLINQFVTGSGGQYSLNSICRVGSLSGDGSYSYYISQAVVSNDLKGIAAFILAGREIEILVATQ